jgi:hypothetical protein
MDNKISKQRLMDKRPKCLQNKGVKQDVNVIETLQNPLKTYFERGAFNHSAISLRTV